MRRALPPEGYVTARPRDLSDDELRRCGYGLRQVDRAVANRERVCREGVKWLPKRR